MVLVGIRTGGFFYHGGAQHPQGGGVNGKGCLALRVCLGFELVGVLLLGEGIVGQAHGGVGHRLAVQQHLHAQGAAGFDVRGVGEQHKLQILTKNLGVQLVIVTSDYYQLYSIYCKMVLKEQRFHSIMDIYAFRVIVHDPDICYRVLGQMHSLYKPRPGRFKDYIAIPKANGYQSLHTSMIGPHGVPVEVQIRTEDMDQMAEMGVAAHWAYKEHGGESSTTAQIRAQRWMQSLLELQQSAGSSFEFIESVKSDLFPDEIYVFTPEGRIVELPAGATPVDFAYAVHTDIGHACVGARVDRQPYPLSQPLSSGQTVEIITAPGARPNAAWLNFVVSSKARAKIRQLLKNLKRDDSVSLGRRLLNHALGGSRKLAEIPPENIQRELDRMKLATLD